MYNSNNPTKFGLKISVLSESINGYILNFNLYYGKQKDSPGEDLLKMTKTGTPLGQTLIKDTSNSPSDHHVFVDSYFNSLQLAQELMKMNMFVTGAILRNRKCQNLGQKLGCNTYIF